MDWLPSHVDVVIIQNKVVPFQVMKRKSSISLEEISESDFNSNVTAALNMLNAAYTIGAIPESAEALVIRSAELLLEAVYRRKYNAPSKTKSIEAICRKLGV